jgi:hypothetical protein
LPRTCLNGLQVVDEDELMEGMMTGAAAAVNIDVWRRLHLAACSCFHLDSQLVVLLWNSIEQVAPVAGDEGATDAAPADPDIIPSDTDACRWKV